MTGHLTVDLRPLAAEDWAAVHQWANHEQVYRYQAWGPNTESETREFVRVAAEAWGAPDQTWYVYAIRFEGMLVGNCDLRLRGGEQGEIGYLLHPDHWGRGVATAAAQRLIELGFTQHGLHRIYATCDPRNTTSAAVLQRVGMTHEGRLRENLRIRDGWRDSDLYSVLVHEWSRSAGSDP